MKEFFDKVRQDFGPLSQSQVDGIELIVKTAAKASLRHQAYILATAWHETAKTMQPIAEFGKGNGKKYGIPDTVTGQTYYGRGFVQLTWKDNYAKAERRLKELSLISNSVDFVNNPDLVMKPNISALILVVGMTEGWFTGKKLADYDAYTNMRRVVNGIDRAELIASYAFKFEEALKAMKTKPISVPLPDVPPIVKHDVPVKGMEKSIAAIIIGAIIAAFAAFGAWIIGGN